jgi:polyphosphate kinase 2 (PPK2 family)
LKQWKITDEDWRNRRKWNDYKKAVDEMIYRTSTPLAPWTIVESNCKLYGRIKVLDTVIDAIEKRLGN